MAGTLLVIDGLDGSGKSTQASLLCERLQAEGKKVLLISYPDYEKPSSTLVRMYLGGELSDSAEAVNAYAASSFYAVDRYASYMQHWQELYDDDTVVIASRYTSSNAIHQMGKLPVAEWDGFLAWLTDFEHDKLGLPKPDGIFFLDMSRKVADGLISSRYHGDESKRDLHEENMQYLEYCMKSAHYAAEKEGWQVIRCCDGEHAYPIDQIAQMLYEHVINMIAK